MAATTIQPAPPRWLHGWALLTLAATLPLLVLGAEVTTKGAGMSDPVGYRGPLELIQLLADAVGLGLQLEYSHRLAGMVVGLCTIVLALGCWFAEPRRAVRWAGVAALALVITQGLIGKYRVDLNALFGKTAALVHGSFAQVVIATLVGLVVVTSRRWRADRSDPAQVSPALRRWSLLTVVLLYAQVLLGGVVRHKESLLGPRGHLVGAFVVLAAVVWLTRLVADSEADLRRPMRLLLGLVAVQIYLGVETWLSRFFVPAADLPQLRPVPGHADYFRSTHTVVGTLTFAAGVALALWAHRRPVPAAAAALPRHLEGAL